MIILSDKQIQQVLTPDLAVRAIEMVFEQEGKGKTVLPTRLNFPVNHGWFRTMPGAIMTGDQSGIMGCKIMNLHKDRGLYYLILLYDQETGQPVALMDAAAITAMRTGAVSAVAARRILDEDVEELGLVGTGFEAKGQLTAFASALPLKKVKVFSRKAENRDEFAREMSASLGIDIEPVDDGAKAVSGQRLVVLATKSSVPVIDGDWLEAGSTVVSISVINRELDRKAMQRAAWIVVDHKEQVMNESADIKIALSEGILDEERFVEIAQVHGSMPSVAGKDVLIFKSTGTALQDLAVAHQVYLTCKQQGIGTSIEDFPYLKIFK